LGPVLLCGSGCDLSSANSRQQGQAEQPQEQTTESADRPWPVTDGPVLSPGQELRIKAAEFPSCVVVCHSIGVRFNAHVRWRFVLTY
jgi:hypothetical protein